jgi:MFS family permease
VLASTSMSFPNNYGILFAAAGLFFFLELIAVAFIEDRHDPSRREGFPLRSLLPRVAAVLREDRTYRRMVIVRLLVGLSSVATPFYVIYGLDSLRLGPQSIGLFTAAQIAGGIVSAPLLEVLGERKGPRSVIRATAAIALLMPVIALLCSALTTAFSGAALLAIFAAVFAALGAANNGSVAGFTNYICEHAPPDHRPLYIGMANTLNGAILVAPFIGGWILSASTFPVLFAVAALGSAAGFAGTLFLPLPRKASQ